MPTKRPGRGVDGVIPVIPIPFDANEEIDEAALRRLIDFAVEAGVGAVCLPAYGSEFFKLSDHERIRVVKITVEQAAGRLLVMAQCNHGSARVALSLAKANIEAGADFISIAIPRQFGWPDDDLLRYLATVLNGVQVPCLVQDFNPGGPTVTVDFVVRLRSECPNLRYLKLEEPLLAKKVTAIREATKDQVGILEGWGGLYMMELIPLGICGTMPGLPMADFLNVVFDLRRENKSEEAFALFGRVLPHMVFALQNMELYVYMDKRLLQARGLLTNANCRSVRFTPDPDSMHYIDELTDRVLKAIEEVGLPALVK